MFAGVLTLTPFWATTRRTSAVTGQHLGNFPQAFSHLALIDAVTRLIDSEETKAKQGTASATA